MHRKSYMALDWHWEICVSPFLWFLVVLEATMTSESSLVPWLVLVSRSTCNVLTVLLIFKVRLPRLVEGLDVP
ncbi:hypothetical protein EDB86DRAFT_2918636 [Lactarius hatsudake]|nr:hypothetical protein EDB86DRAFT_2918636 [Lactarius hatsudake]